MVDAVVGGFVGHLGLGRAEGDEDVVRVDPFGQRGQRSEVADKRHQLRVRQARIASDDDGDAVVVGAREQHRQQLRADEPGGSEKKCFLHGDDAKRNDGDASLCALTARSARTRARALLRDRLWGER